MLAGLSEPGGGHFIYGRLTHHVEVISAALGAPVEAGQQHVFDVVARSVVELAHVEGAGLVVVKVGPLLQDLQDVLLNQVWISDLVSGKEGSPLKEKGPEWQMPKDNASFLLLLPQKQHECRHFFKVV